MVEDVEELAPNFNSHGFVNLDSLRHTHIGVENSGAVEEPAIGVAECPHGAGSESARQEICVRAIGTGLPGILNLDWTDEIWDVGSTSTVEVNIPALADVDGKPDEKRVMPTFHPCISRLALPKARSNGTAQL